MTAPVPPAHLSFIDGIFFLRPVCGSSLKTMIFASWPPSSMTECTSGWSVSTASDTAVTSCTNFAPMSGARRAASGTGDEDAAVGARRATGRPRAGAETRGSSRPASFRGAGSRTRRSRPCAPLDGHRLDRGGSDIDADEELLRHVRAHARTGLRRPRAAAEAVRRRMRSSTCSTKFAAVPVTPFRRGTW